MMLSLTRAKSLTCSRKNLPQQKQLFATPIPSSLASSACTYGCRHPAMPCCAPVSLCGCRPDARTGNDGLSTHLLNSHQPTSHTFTRWRSTAFAMRTPFSISQPMPMDTLGPILQSLPIFAEGCTITLPSNSGPAASDSGAVLLSELRWSWRPAEPEEPYVNKEGQFYPLPA